MGVHDITHIPTAATTRIVDQADLCVRNISLLNIADHPVMAVLCPGHSLIVEFLIVETLAVLISEFADHSHVVVINAEQSIFDSDGPPGVIVVGSFSGIPGQGAVHMIYIPGSASCFENPGWHSCISDVCFVEAEYDVSASQFHSHC
jgi:hypothetical protein